MKIIIPLLLVLGFFLAAQPALTGSDPVGKAVIELTAGKKGDVTFPHQTHQKTLGDCQVCHTLFPMEKGAIQLMITQRKLKQKQAMTHCMTCHRAKRKEGVKSGPTSCSQCHKK